MDEALSAAELYDLRTTNVVEDLKFIQDLARRSGPTVLELACGTGRILSAIEAPARELWGVDLWSDALDVARRKVPRATLVPMDMRSFSLARKFDLVILGFNSLEQLLTAEDQRAMLERVRVHLTPIARFYIHTTPFDPESFVPHTGPTKLTSLTTPDGRDVRVEFEARRDLESRISDVQFRYFVRGLAAPVEDRFTVRPLTADEVFELLRSSGFEIDEIYGGFQRQPFIQGESPVMVVVCSWQ